MPLPDILCSCLIQLYVLRRHVLIVRCKVGERAGRQGRLLRKWRGSELLLQGVVLSRQLFHAAAETRALQSHVEGDRRPVDLAGLTS